MPASSDLPHIQRDIVKLKLFAFCVSNFYELGLLDLIELTVTGRIGYLCNLLIFDDLFVSSTQLHEKS